MIDSPEALAVDALRTRLDALVLDPAVPVAWPRSGASEEPPADANGAPSPYLRPDVSWNRSISRGVARSSAVELRGLLQVTVLADARGGELLRHSVAGAVVAHFRRGTEMTSGDVTVRVGDGPPWLASLPDDGPYSRLGVIVPFYAFTIPG